MFGNSDKKQSRNPQTVRQITANIEGQLSDLFDLEERLNDDIQTQQEIIKSAQTRIADNSVELERSVKARHALAAVYNEMNG